jgi:hypothetical protein
MFIGLLIEWLVFTLILMTLVDLTIQVALSIWMFCIILGIIRIWELVNDEDKKKM